MTHRTTVWITRRSTRWTAAVLALTVVLGLSALAGRLGDVQSNDRASWLPADAESTKVIEQTAKLAPDDEIPAIVVYVRESGIEPGDADLVRDDLAALAEVDHVQGVAVPGLTEELSADRFAQVISEDGKAIQAIVTLKISEADEDQLPDVIDSLRQIVQKHDGLRGYVGGPAAFGADQAEGFAGIEGILLLAALAVVVVLLLLTYRSPVLWLIPLTCGLLSVGAARGAIYLLAKYADLTVNGQSAGILAVLVLGASIDYALLLVARYREELRVYESRFEAMAHALHRAAPAIVASGATVIVSLLVLTLASLNSTAALGPVSAVGIALALLVMLVLLPLFLVACGRWVFWPFIPHHGEKAKDGSGLWANVGAFAGRRPRAVWTGTAAILAIACIGIIGLNAGPLSNADTFTTEQQSVVADEIIGRHYPAGEGSPLQVVAHADHADEVSAALDDIDGLVPAMGDDGPTSRTGVVAGDRVYLERLMTSASDSEESYATVQQARDSLHAIDGADALVGGDAAVNVDTEHASAADNRLLIPLILLVVLVVLAILLRSVVAPLVLLGTVALSFGAAVGLSALMFQHVFGWSGVDTSFPLYAFVFLVALGIDYNIFLMTRVREESLHLGTHRGALVGLAATGGVITSAGLVLAGTFSALATLPIVFLAQIGIVVALGVLLDTIIVRSILVTALTLDIGRWMWWPSRLWRTDGEVESQEAAS